MASPPCVGKRDIARSSFRVVRPKRGAPDPQRFLERGFCFRSEAAVQRHVCIGEGVQSYSYLRVLWSECFAVMGNGLTEIVHGGLDCRLIIMLETLGLELD